MVDPVVTPLVLTPLVTAAAGWVAQAVTQQAVGDVSLSLGTNLATSQLFDPVCGRIRKAFGLHMNGRDGSLARNHDVERAVRTAQMLANRAMIARYASLAERRNLTSERGFVRKASAWVESQIKRIDGLTVGDQTLDALVAAIEAPLVSGGSLVSEAAAATLAALAELETGVGEAATDGFRHRFLGDGAVDQGPWFAAFGAFLAEEIKENDRFRAILTATQLADLGAGVRDIRTVLTAWEPVWTAIDERTREIQTQLDRIEAKNDAGHAKTQADTGEILELLKAERGAEAAEVARLRDDIERLATEGEVKTRAVEGFLNDLGETPLTPDQWSGQLATFADRYRALTAEASPRTNMPAALEIERLRAEAAIESGDLDLAEAVLTDLSARIAAWRREQQETLDQTARDEAAVLARRAEVAKTRLRYLEAADLYGQAAAAEPTKDREAVWRQVVAQASVLDDQGREFGDNEALIRAIDLYGQALALVDRETSPSDWATTQNNLGIALWTLGGRETGTSRLDEAVAAYRAALEERTRERAPMDWAQTQNNLGIVLRALGARESVAARFEEAVTAYQAALEELTRERVPLAWAGVQNNLGVALSELGRQESGTARLEEAVAAYWAALGERTRERVPLAWAGTQNNLGIALQALGGRENGTKRLEGAVAAYRAALEELTRERAPYPWANAQENLGIVCHHLFARTGDQTWLDLGLDAARGALEVYEQAGADYDIGTCRALIADLEVRRNT